MQLFHKLARLTPAKLVEGLKSPWKIPVKLAAPPTLSAQDATATLFPEADRNALMANLESVAPGSAFQNELNAAMQDVRGRKFYARASSPFLYLVIRQLRPELVVETGVFDGESRAFILKALDENRQGQLISIDLPATTAMSGSTTCMPESSLPVGRSPGWIIPERLRGRHDLRLGDARALLPACLEEFGAVDAFLHDSLHTADHMMFEYRTAWPRLRSGGLLLSDDIYWNPAFHLFSRSVGRPYLRTDPGDMGIIRKP